MPDHKEMGREPTEREREITFAPHDSPVRQGDGDPGRKKPRLDPQPSEAAPESDDADSGDDAAPDKPAATARVAGKRGMWQNPPAR